MELKETTRSVVRVFQGRALALDVLEVERPDGRRSSREVVRHSGAAVVLGQRPDGLFVLVRQFRCAIGETLLEAVAGCLEPGETAEDCARRELEEESGYRALSLTSLGVMVPCPGYSDERLHLFYASVPLHPAPPRRDADENLETVLMSADAVDAALAAGTLIDGKSIAVWLLWRHRNRPPEIGRSAGGLQPAGVIGSG